MDLYFSNGNLWLYNKDTYVNFGYITDKDRKKIESGIIPLKIIVKLHVIGNHPDYLNVMIKTKKQDIILGTYDKFCDKLKAMRVEL